MVHTGARYHTQDTGYYCGAAAAMMILAEIGVPYSSLDQDDLYNSNHNNNAQGGWYTDPYGLRHTLVDNRPSGFTNTFGVQKPTSEAEGTRKIVYTLHKYEVSPAVLVFGCAHWIVVPGVQTDVEPVSGATYTVQGFWIHNPVHQDNEPHSATDVCGSGGASGNANDYITYANWQANYFTGCNYDDSSGNKQYISVCDPDEPNLKLPLRAARKFLFDGRELIARENAIQISQESLKTHNLLEDKRVADIVSSGRPGKPISVLRLDRANTYYYLVPWEQEGRVAAITQVDARFGEFLGLHLREAPLEKEFLHREEVLKSIANEKIQLSDMMGRVKLDPEIACLSPTLVWQPCWESWSPHLPFYQFTIGEHKLYVRVDGEVFSRLTTTGRGT